MTTGKLSATEYKITDDGKALSRLQDPRKTTNGSLPPPMLKIGIPYL